MSILGDLKKIFFGAKSVAKHQAEKAGEFAKEVGGELLEQGSELAGKAKSQLENLADKGEAFAEKAMDRLEDLGEDLSEKAAVAKEKAFEIGGELGEKAAIAKEKALDLGEDLAEKGKAAAGDTKNWINERLGSINTAAQEGADKVADTAAEATDALEDSLDLSDLGHDLSSEAKKALDFEADLPSAPAAPSALREVADQALDKAAAAGLGAKAAAEKLGGKLMDVSEKVGEKVLEKGSDALDKAAELGAGLKDKADALVEKASAAAEKESLDEAIENAKAAAEQAEARARAFGGKEGERDASSSLLDGTDSFFDRAAKFADGDYHREGSVRLTDSETPQKPKPNDAITGFDDKDGDGDALIDDAEISE